MHRVSVRDARNHLRSIMNRVSAGEEVVILRRGKEVARISPPARRSIRLPDLSGFRASIRVKGEPMSVSVAKARKVERY